MDRSWARAAEERVSRTAPTLGEYARAIGRRKLIVATCIGLGLLLGTVVLPSVIPNQGTFQATVRLKVAQLVSDTIVRERPQFESEETESVGNALQDVALADEVLNQLGDRATGLSAQDVVRVLTATPVPDSSFVDLAYTDTNEARARSVAAAYAKAWASRRNAIDIRRLKAATDGLDAQIAELQNLITELDGPGPASEVQKTKLSQAQSRLNALAGLRDNIVKQRLFLGPPTAVLGTAVTNQVSAPISSALVLVLGLLIGLLAGAGLALIAEAARPKVLTPSDVEQATGMPVIASVAPGGMRSDLPVLKRPFSPAAEGFRRLAGALERRGFGDDIRILTIASADRREGRSLLAANLAHLLARQGRDVLLVSGDLRRRRLDELMGLAEEPGLAEWLETPQSAAELPLRLVTDRLLLLPAGTTQRSPSELLTAAPLKQGLERLAKTGFLVVIDAPPALSSAESMVLTAVADATLLVTRVGISRWRTIEHVAEVLRRDGMNTVGTVLLGDRGRSASLLRTFGLGYSGRHQAGPHRKPTRALPASEGNDNGTQQRVRPKSASRGG